MHFFAADGATPVSAALDALSNRLGVGMLLAGEDGQLLFASRRALDLLGCGPGVDAADVQERWAGLRLRLPRAQAGAQAVSFTLDVPAGANPLMLRGQCRLLEAGTTEILLSDRRSLGELDLELLCASRMKEWVHQCEALVHDANGALNTIQLTLELLDGQWPGTRAGEQVREPHRRNHVGVIRDNLDKLKHSLRELVAAHDEPQAAGPYDVGDLLREAAVTLRMPARRKRIELLVGGAGLPLRARGNRARLRQALVNVALCRIEMLPERAKFRIDAAGEGDGRVTISCADEGSLTDAARAGIYQLLLAEAGAGSAADALRLARAIVESEGGELVVESSQAGTQLRLILPAA